MENWILKCNDQISHVKSKLEKQIPDRPLIKEFAVVKNLIKIADTLLKTIFLNISI